MSADKLDKEYDFIVVGSGAGGGPVAVRLAEAGYSVLTLEAGGAEEPSTTRSPPFMRAARKTISSRGNSTSTTMPTQSRRSGIHKTT